MLVPRKNAPPLLPPRETAVKLFVAGSTVGPIVDSLHNQCLLTYDFGPITLDVPDLFDISTSAEHLFASSWAVPPLLGLAYVILGYILPRIIEWIIHLNTSSTTAKLDVVAITVNGRATLKTRAILAVSSTAAVIKLSEFLETHSGVTYQLFDTPILLDATTNLMIMILADVLQWISLDGTLVALLAAIVTAFGGPLSELPFVANGFWHYNSEAADYLPLSGMMFQPGGFADTIASKFLGGEYKELAISSITGPCYFAVTLDAIALGRYFNERSTTDKW
jgi:hypothetical protein